MSPLLFILLICAAAADPKAEWESQVEPETRSQPAFAFVEEDPALPRILLIGDSISVGYTTGVRELLKGKANVLRIPVNGGPTSRGIECIDGWLGHGKWDAIHFNWGLHDVKRVKNGKMDISADWQIDAKQYRKNLEVLVEKLNATGARIVWASTTPIPDGAAGRIKGDEVIINKIARKVMKKNKVPVNDLYAHVLPHLEKYQQPRNVHFTNEGSAWLAQKVVAAIVQAMEKHRP